jgi:hypothetical protein
MMMGNLVHTSTVLLRRERLERVGSFNEELKVSGEDYDFHLRTCRAGAVAFIDVSSIQYQIGRNDQLTHRKHAIYMALNFLATIAPFLDAPQSIELPSAMLDHVQAHAYAWIGSEYLELGQSLKAREHLCRSLRFVAWQPKIFLYWLLSFLTANASHRLIVAARNLKRGLRRLVNFSIP